MNVAELFDNLGATLNTAMQSYIPMWIFLFSMSFSPFAALATIRKMYVPDDRLSYLTEPEEPEYSTRV